MAKSIPDFSGHSGFFLFPQVDFLIRPEPLRKFRGGGGRPEKIFSIADTTLVRNRDNFISEMGYF